jgi:hypothetical protein
MEENAHIPPRLWSGYGSGTTSTANQWFLPGVIGGIPLPHVQLVYFEFLPQVVTQAGVVTLFLPTSGSAPGIVTSAGVASPVKTWAVTAIETVQEFIPPIPIGFDTAGVDTFTLMNGDPNGNFRSAFQFTFMISVLPLH